MTQRSYVFPVLASLALTPAGEAGEVTQSAMSLQRAGGKVYQTLLPAEARTDFEGFFDVNSLPSYVSTELRIDPSAVRRA